MSIDSSTPGASSPPPLTFSVWMAGIIRRRRKVLLVVLATVALLVVAGLVIPPVYRAEASFVANPSASRLPSSLSGAGPLQGLTAQLSMGALRDPSESPGFYAALVRSQEVRRRLATSHFPNPRTSAIGDSATLLDILRIRHSDPQRRLEIAVKRLKKMIGVRSDAQTSIVNIIVDTRWGNLSAQLANRTVELVDSFNREQRVSRARSKRGFLATRLGAAFQTLGSTEDRLRQFYEQNRRWRDSPSLTFEESRQRRNVELATDLYVNLQQQFELARLEEFNDAALITVVDRALEPRKAQWPRWGILFVSAVILGTLLGAVGAGSAVVLEDWRARNPAAAKFFDESLPGFWPWRRTQRKGVRGRIAT